MPRTATPFEVTDTDRRFYEARLKDFLPDRIVDIHTHVYRARRAAPTEEENRRLVSWPSRVARENPVEHHLETYRLMFPDKVVLSLIFSTVPTRATIHPMNRYVSRVARAHGLPALIFADPLWPAEELERRVVEGGFRGAKVYLSLAPSHLPAHEVRIFDYAPPHQLEVLDRHGWILMLHIPRPQRLRDPVNLAQLLEIEQRYRRLNVIVAHVGRAYCPADVGHAFEVLAPTRRMMFDISANTNETVFRRLIEAVGPRRILFGSDLPVARMRMRRICENGTYVNIVPRGLYGDVSGDPHMRETDGADAARLTFFMYETIDAFRRAAEATGLSKEDVRDVFFGNADRLLRRTTPSPSRTAQGVVGRGRRR